MKRVTTTKPSRGRPALVTGRRRGSPQIKATVTLEELASLKREANYHKMSLSALIRWRLLGQ